MEFLLYSARFLTSKIHAISLIKCKRSFAATAAVVAAAAAATAAVAAAAEVRAAEVDKRFLGKVKTFKKLMDPEHPAVVSLKQQLDSGC